MPTIDIVKTKKLIFILPLIILSAISFAQDKGMKEIEDKILTLCEQFNEVRLTSIPESKKIALEVNSLADSINSPLLKGKALFVLACSYYDERNITQSTETLEKALKYFEESNFQEGIADVYSNLGLNNYSNNKYEKSLEYHIKALKIRESQNDQVKLNESYSRISFVFIQQKQFDEALNYLKRIVAISKELKDTVGIIKTSFNIANLYQRKEELDTSHIYLDSTEYLANAIGMNFGVAKVEGMRAYVYMDQGKYEEALAAISKAESIYSQMEIAHEILQMVVAKARVYQEMKNYSKMLAAANKAVKLSAGNEDYEVLKEVFEALYIANKEMGFPAEALIAHEKFTSFNDSIFSVENAAKINELNTKYETEKKEAEIVSLSQQASIQELEIKQKNQTIIIGLSATILLIGVIYFIYRQRLLKNQQFQIELEQRFLRSQLNPHFIFNALGAIQNFMLKNSAQEAGIYLAKFSRLMRQILENSREAYISVEEEVKMLENYLSVHRLRLDNSFEFKILIDESIDQETEAIPPMFVQPFVENAIEHGIISAKGQGLIELHLRKENEFITIEVTDNGAGSIKTPEKKHKSLATTIIGERIDLFNKNLKDKIQLLTDEMKSETGEVLGTKVELKVPFKYI